MKRQVSFEAVKARPDEGMRRTPAVRLEREGPVATLVLDRPERHNALGSADIVALHECLDTLGGDPGVRVVVVTGAGDRTFCAGAALDEMESGEMDEHRFETLTDRLVRFDRPTIAALNGAVIFDAEGGI